MNQSTDSTPLDRPRLRFGLHPDIFKLGWVSFLTDLSSEMIFSVFAIFFTTVAGASAALLGVIEGLADLSACSLNYLSGWLSDRTGQRKRFAAAGYAFSTLAKLILLFSNTVLALGLFRVIERLGKGFRGPPRDAWLAALADAKTRGYSFGVHKALDKAGAVLGPLLAYGLLSWSGETPQAYQTLFWVAFAPALLALLVLARIDEPPPGVARQRESLARHWQALSPEFKRFLLSAGIFALGYFSLGFVLVRAHALGFDARDIVLLYALFNATCVLAAPLAGKLGDQIGRRPIVVLGYGLYGSINLALVFVTQQWQMVALMLVYGVFYAVEESQSKAFIADLEPQ
ncbi:MAG: MFS transporter, partial [Rhodoferax sp.]